MTWVDTSDTGGPGDIPGNDFPALRNELVALRTLALDVQRRVAALEEQLRPAKAGPARSPVFPTLYPDFEDRFRGSEAEIRRRLQVYLPDAHHLVGSGGIVDVGPGRCEWLRLLQEAGLPAYGIDVNQAFVEAGRARGVDVRAGEAVAHLNAVPAGSIDLVTAFHVIEHLDIEELIGLIDAAGRALRAGGGLLFETPNPTNLVMGACDFYCDPTHGAPLPPELPQYLMTARGFEAVEVRHLHPKPVAFTVDDLSARLPPALAETLMWRLFGPQDYAVLGYRRAAEPPA